MFDRINNVFNCTQNLVLVMTSSLEIQFICFKIQNHIFSKIIFSDTIEL